MYGYGQLCRRRHVDADRPEEAECGCNAGPGTGLEHRPGVFSRSHQPEGCGGALRRRMYRRGDFFGRTGADESSLRIWLYPAAQFGGTRLSDRWFLGHGPQPGASLRGTDCHVYRPYSGRYGICGRAVEKG